MTEAVAARLVTGEMRFSVVIGATLFVHSALAFVWAGAAAERIHQLERRADAATEIIERTARLEEQMYAVRASLARIETRLEARDGAKP